MEDLVLIMARYYGVRRRDLQSLTESQRRYYSTAIPIHQRLTKRSDQDYIGTLPLGEGSLMRSAEILLGQFGFTDPLDTRIVRLDDQQLGQIERYLRLSPVTRDHSGSIIEQTNYVLESCFAVRIEPVETNGYRLVGGEVWDRVTLNKTYLVPRGCRLHPLVVKLGLRAVSSIGNNRSSSNR